MANVARAPRTPKTAPAAAVVAANAAPATTPAPTTQAPAGGPLYTLSAKAQALATATTPGNTLQRPAPGLGMAWRTAGHTAPNTRAGALAVVLAASNGQPFTQAQAQQWLQAAKASGLNLGSGTPGSYAKAFVGNGYFAPCSA